MPGSGLPTPPLRVLALTQDAGSSVARIRLARPLGALARSGAITFALRPFHALRRYEVRNADVIVLQRALDERWLRHLRQWHADGIAVAYDIDDLLTDPAPHLLQRDAMLARQPTLRALLAEADRVTAATAPLAEAMRALGARVLTVPNVGQAYAGAPARHDDSRPLSLIVASSDRQQIEPLAAALRQWLAERSRAAQSTVLIGVGPMAGVLAAAGLPHRALPLLAPDDFLQTLAALPNPIGLIPLDASAFSGCKSAVKWFDYAVAGIPTLCAARSPYVDVVTSGVDGWLCADQPEAWLDALRDAGLQAARRRSVAAAARAAVQRAHTPAHQQAAWLAALVEARAARPTVSPRRLARLVDGLLDLIDAPRRALTEANRRRLAQRRR